MSTGSPSPSPAGHDSPLSTGALVGITLGSVLGGLLLACAACILVRRCLRRRYAQRTSGGLDQPLGSGLGWKESELVASANVEARLDDLDGLHHQGLSSAAMGQQGSHALSVALPDGLLGSQASHLSAPHGKTASILRWLESAEIPGLRASAVRVGPAPEVDLETGKASSGCIPGLARISKAQGELADMRKKLLDSANYGENSSTQPLDLMGVVFSRLPPSRGGTPAASTIDTVVSKARQSRLMPQDSAHTSMRPYTDSQLQHPGHTAASHLRQTLSLAVAGTGSNRAGAAVAVAAAGGTGSAATISSPGISLGGINYVPMGSLTRTSAPAPPAPSPKHVAKPGLPTCPTAQGSPVSQRMHTALPTSTPARSLPQRKKPVAQRAHPAGHEALLQPQSPFTVTAQQTVTVTHSPAKQQGLSMTSVAGYGVMTYPEAVSVLAATAGQIAGAAQPHDNMPQYSGVHSPAAQDRRQCAAFNTKQQQGSSVSDGHGAHSLTATARQQVVHVAQGSHAALQAGQEYTGAAIVAESPVLSHKGRPTAGLPVEGHETMSSTHDDFTLQLPPVMP